VIAHTGLCSFVRMVSLDNQLYRMPPARSIPLSAASIHRFEPLDRAWS
jgi:hypothetical protein